MPDEDDKRPVLSIGALSRATGVPANTLRTWERRYGFPEATRSPGGQRQYDAALIPHLALIQRALSQQHRPSQVLKLNFAQLQQLMGMAKARAATPQRSGPILQMMLDATTALDARALDHLLTAGLSRWGAVPFIEQHLIPFLQAIGTNWENGSMNIFHEHFASQRVTGVLQSRWQLPGSGSPKGRVVLTTLPNESHVMGLHMAALVLAQANHQLVFLGPNTPISDIARCAVAVSADAIAVSVSEHANPEETVADLKQLSEAVVNGVSIIAGGAGAPEVEGVRTMRSLSALAEWAER